MPAADAQSAGHPRRTGQGLLWAMLAALVVLAAVAVVAMLGWNTAISRADEQTSRAAALRTAADQSAGLQQRAATLQQDLADAREREQALQARLAAGKAALTEVQNKATAAEERAAAAEKATSNAERTHAELQEKLDAALAASVRTAERSAPPQAASNISAATVQSDTAAELPLPGLPAGATARDYLVAAQQAVHNGSAGRAQAALERAETRMLNQASLARSLARPASHPGIAEVEHALDQLGNGDAEGALRTIDGLLTQP